MARFLVTGGLGFIGSTLVRLLLSSYPECTVTVLDLMTYAGSGGNLDHLSQDPRLKVIKGDIVNVANLIPARDVDPYDCVFHLAAESHVDRSTMDAAPFVHTNVLGTQAVIDWMRAGGARIMVHVSTDEVYGSLGPKGRFTTTSPYDPRNVYAATKAASDHLARAAVNTHGLDIRTTHCSNNYGPYQFPEKLVPMTITRMLSGEKVTLHGSGNPIRDWIHVKDHARGLLEVYEKGKKGRVYNFGARSELTNNQVVEAIRRILAPSKLFEDVVAYVEDRAGQDERYAIDPMVAVDELQWAPHYDFQYGIRETVEWYVLNRQWWSRLSTTDILSLARVGGE